MTIIGHRSFRHFFLAIFLFDFYFLSLALMIWSLRDQALSATGYFIMILMVGILVFGAVYIVFRYYKNAPSISVDEESITLGNSTYCWADLENIEMTGKRSFKFMGEQKEGMLLRFKGQKDKYIFDDLYKNISEIKSFIKAVAIDKREPKELVPDCALESDEEFGLEKPKYYKGFPLFSLEGVFHWGLIAFFCPIGILDFLNSHDMSSLIMFPALCLLVLILLGRRTHYFGVSKVALVVKNYYRPWIKIEYGLANIEEIVFEQRHKMPVTLRVICKDFSSKTYPAATLWGKTWIQLKEDLEKKGIKVRNECVFWEPFEFKLFNND